VSTSGEKNKEKRGSITFLLTGSRKGEREEKEEAAAAVRYRCHYLAALYRRKGKKRKIEEGQGAGHLYTLCVPVAQKQEEKRSAEPS